jgi:tRNA A37 threonylcarbamoyladenosine dehydratase
MLLGDDFDKITSAKILLLGVGGVGSFCLDCLHRNGIHDITIIDFDCYDASNQNRQMWSELHEGESKVEAMQKHYPQIKIMEMKITPEWVEAFDFEPYDLVLDAIDDIHAKLALA